METEIPSKKCQNLDTPRAIILSEILKKGIQYRCYFLSLERWTLQKQPDSIDNFCFRVLVNEKGSLVK